MKTTKFFLMAALALTFAACSNEDNDILLPEQPAQPAQNEGITITATLAPKTGGAATRAVSEGTGDDAGNIVASWDENEHIAILYTVGSEKKVADATITDVDETTGVATISFTVVDGTPDNTPCTLVYPAKLTDGTTTVYKDDNSGVKDYADLLATQDGTLNANLDVRVGAGTIQVSPPSLKVTTQPAPQYSIFKFTVQEDASNSPIAPNKFQVSDNAGNVITTITNITTTNVLYAALPALSAGTYLFSATVGGETLFAKAKVATATTAGNFYQTTVMMKPAVDLSMVNNAGDARDKQWTANCYMVHTAGLYKLPLVYGNAIKDGEVNTTAFNPGGTKSETYCANFVNHEGNDINAPWITKNTSGAGVDKGMGITVKSAELLWQDAQGLITAVAISGDYLLLAVGKDATTQQGNALVAAKTSDGTIVWSWHIWVTTETFATADLTAITTGTTGTQGTDYQIYKVTPVNLGWVPTDGKKGYAPYYQWGRKDAFIPGTWNANTDHTVYSISGAPVTGLNYHGNTTATIADNIKNPTTFYKNNTTTYYNMWDAQQKSTDNIAAATKKTVYDPCPAGFCVPTGNLYTFMGNDTNKGTGDLDDTNKGRTWTKNTPNLYFPASGYRTYGNGSLFDVGSNGYYWSASALNSNDGLSLSFSSSYWDWNYDGRANGFPVRAVAEEE